MPDFVVGLHIATGSGRTLWIERASKPVLSEDFAAKIGADLIRDDDIFNAAVVSFGTFGIIAAVAVETAPVYQLEFPPIADIHHDDLKTKLTGFGDADPADLYHYEFIFDPHGRKQMAMEAGAPKVPFEPGHATPKPRWIVRDKNGYAPGINILRVLGLLRFLPPRFITGIQFKQYRKLALLDGVRGTPGQLYTSSIYYLEGYTESAFGVSVRDAPETIDICSEVAREMRLPSISQVRLVHRSEATLGFTQHEPKRRSSRSASSMTRGSRNSSGGWTRRSGRPGSATRCTGRRTRGSTRRSSTTCMARRRSRAGRRRGGPSSTTTRR